MMTQEEFYAVDEISMESTASLTEEYIEETAKEKKAVTTDMAQTLEAIDILARNRYINYKDLEPLAETLHTIEDRLQHLADESDPNRMPKDDAERKSRIEADLAGVIAYELEKEYGFTEDMVDEMKKHYTTNRDFVKAGNAYMQVAKVKKDEATNYGQW